LEEKRENSIEREKKTWDQRKGHRCRDISRIVGGMKEKVTGRKKESKRTRRLAKRALGITILLAYALKDWQYRRGEKRVNRGVNVEQ